MKKYGLIGYPLEHSYSKEIFNEIFLNKNIQDTEYELFPLISIDHLPALLKEQHELLGFNVTIPYKQTVIDHLSIIMPDAQMIGAVNTVLIDRTSEPIVLHGYNTDSYAFEITLRELIGTNKLKTLILGDGGASKAVQFVLKKLRISFIVASRNPKSINQIRYNEITKQLLKEYLLIINTTPLGMFPDTTAYPDIPYQFLSSDNIVYDLIYNPEETRLLSLAKSKGVKTFNGLRMLYLQAEKSWGIWNNIP